MREILDFEQALNRGLRYLGPSILAAARRATKHLEPEDGAEVVFLSNHRPVGEATFISAVETVGYDSLRRAVEGHMGSGRLSREEQGTLRAALRSLARGDR